MFGFNETVDKAAIKPLAQGYDAVTPLPVRTGVGNFSVTSATSGSALTICCRAKPGYALNDAGRVLINSTVGIPWRIRYRIRMGLEKAR